MNHQVMNFNPRPNVPLPGPDTVLPFQYPRSLCRLHKDLAGKNLTRYLTNYVRFSLTACAALINTQLRWKLFLFPPLLFINRGEDHFWTLSLFTKKQKHILGTREQKTSQKASLILGSLKASVVSERCTELGNRRDNLRTPLAQF